MNIVNANGECEVCPDDSFPNGERNSCSECKPDEIVDYDGSCKRCPDGFVITLLLYQENCSNNRIQPNLT